MEQKDYKKILRKIQLNANMFADRNMFAGWVYSMVATELDENAHWTHMDTAVLEEFNKEIDQELRRRRGEQMEDKKKQEPATKLPKIYPPSDAIMKKVSPKVKKALSMDIAKSRVKKELEGFSDAFKVRDKKKKAAKKKTKKAKK